MNEFIVRVGIRIRAKDAETAAAKVARTLRTTTHGRFYEVTRLGLDGLGRDIDTGRQIVWVDGDGQEEPQDGWKKLLLEAYEDLLELYECSEEQVICEWSGNITAEKVRLRSDVTKRRARFEALLKEAP